MQCFSIALRVFSYLLLPAFLVGVAQGEGSDALNNCPGLISQNGYVSEIDIQLDPEVFERLKERTREDEAIEVYVSVRIDDYHFEKVQMELHGGTARDWPKRSYRLKFHSLNRPAVCFFSSQPELHRRLVLMGSSNDRTFMRNKLTMDLVRALGGIAPRVGYTFVKVNSAIQGLYTVIERIDREFLIRNGLHPSRNVYKAVTHAANFQLKNNRPGGYERKINRFDTTEDLAELIEILTNTPASYEKFSQYVEPVLDLNQYMLWQMVHTFAMDRDSFNKNYYLYHQRQLKSDELPFRFGLISWDADSTWGNNWQGEIRLPDSTAWHGNEFSERLFSIPEYRLRYLQSYRDAMESILSVDQILKRVTITRDEIAEAARQDLYMWHRGIRAGDLRFGFDAEFARLLANIRIRHHLMTTAISEALSESVSEIALLQDE